MPHDQDGIHTRADNPSNCINNLAIDRATSRVYFTTLNLDPTQRLQIYRSVEGWAFAEPSLTWEPANGGLPLANDPLTSLVSVGRASDSSAHLLALIHPAMEISARVYETTDGLNWVLRGSLLSRAERSLTPVRSAAPSNDLFLSAFSAAYSSNLGMTWTNFRVSSLEHVDTRAIYPDLLRNRLYTVNDGAGETGTFWNITQWSWRPGSAPGGGVGVDEAGLSVWQTFFAGVIPPASPTSPRPTWLGSMDNGIVCSDDAGTTPWLVHPDFRVGDAFGFAYAPSNPDHAYVWDLGGIIVSTNARAACTKQTWVGAAEPFTPPIWHRNVLAVDPNDENHVLLVPGVPNVTHDGAFTLTPRPLGAGRGLSVSAYISPSGTLYVGTEDHGIYSSIDDGVTWNPDGLNGPAPVLVLAMAEAGDAMWAATTGGLYRRAGVGSLWENRIGGSGYVVNDVAIDPSCPAFVYAAFGFVHMLQMHRGGILFSSDGGDTWTSLTSGLDIHQGPVSDVEVDALDSSRVYASTYGQGFWSYDWAGALPTCPVP